jgi:hypothetical protein
MMAPVHVNNLIWFTIEDSLPLDEETVYVRTQHGTAVQRAKFVAHPRPRWEWRESTFQLAYYPYWSPISEAQSHDTTVSHTA